MCRVCSWPLLASLCVKPAVCADYRHGCTETRFACDGEVFGNAAVTVVFQFVCHVRGQRWSRSVNLCQDSPPFQINNHPHRNEVKPNRCRLPLELSARAAAFSLSFKQQRNSAERCDCCAGFPCCLWDVCCVDLKPAVC